MLLKLKVRIRKACNPWLVGIPYSVRNQTVISTNIDPMDTLMNNFSEMQIVGIGFQVEESIEKYVDLITRSKMKTILKDDEFIEDMADALAVAVRFNLNLDDLKSIIHSNKYHDRVSIRNFTNLYLALRIYAALIQFNNMNSLKAVISNHKLFLLILKKAAIKYSDKNIAKYVWQYLWDPLNSILIAQMDYLNRVKYAMKNVVNTPIISDLLSPETSQPVNTFRTKMNAIFFGFKEYVVKLDILGVVTKETILWPLYRFWDEIVTPQFAKTDNKFAKISVMIKVRFTNGQYRSLTKFWTYGPNDMMALLQDCLTYMLEQAIKYEGEEFLVDQVIFSYKLLTEQDSILLSRSPSLRPPILNNWKGGNKFVLPAVWDYLTLPNTVKSFSKYSPNQMFVSGVNLIQEVTGNVLPAVLEVISNNSTAQFVKVFSAKGGHLLTEFMDSKAAANENTFTRTFVNGSESSVVDGVISQETSKEDPQQAFMQALPKASKVDLSKERTAAWDFETRANDKKDENGNVVTDSIGQPEKVLEPVSIAFYSKGLLPRSPIGTTNETWFINDYGGDSDRMMNDYVNFIRNWVISAKKALKLYAHNSAKFDIQFLIRILILQIPSTDSLHIIKNKGKIIMVKWTINGNNPNKKAVRYSISFIDSYLILPVSLAKAAKQFGVTDKTHLDVKGLNQDTDLDAIRDTLLEYNSNDAKVLFEIIQVFAKLVLDNFEVNLLDAPTGASLASRIFRTKYVDAQRDQIALTSKEMYDTLKPAYQGGACDVYKPTNPDGTKVHYYDVNSLYPAMMASKEMPTGKYTHIRGINIDLNDAKYDNAFIKATVTCPDNIEVPLLQQRVDGKSIAGTGKWDGMFYIAELREAIKLGYTIQPHEAIIYEGRNVFSKFINDIYAMRLTYPKSDPMNLICKLTMNSSYGRFGMSPDLAETTIIDKNEVCKFSGGNDIEDILYFGEDKAMVTRSIVRNQVINTDSPNSNLQISLPVAAAITAHSRIEIHRLKLAAAKLGILLYSDTDSLVCSAPLPENLLGKGLGLLKVECTADKAIFLAPKVYALIGVKDGGKDIANIFKAKGVKDMKDLNFEVYKHLLFKDNIFTTHQAKWFRDLEKGNITIRHLKTITRITEGKRQIVLNLQGKFVDTNHMVFDGNKVITPMVMKIGLPAVIENPAICLPAPSIEALRLSLENTKFDMAILRAEIRSQRALMKATQAARTDFTLVNLDFILIDSPLEIAAPESLLMIEAPKPTPSTDGTSDGSPNGSAIVSTIAAPEGLFTDEMYAARMAKGAADAEKAQKEHAAWLETPQGKKAEALAREEAERIRLSTIRNIPPSLDYIPDDSDFIDEDTAAEDTTDYFEELDSEFTSNSARIKPKAKAKAKPKAKPKAKAKPLYSYGKLIEPPKPKIDSDFGNLNFDPFDEIDPSDMVVSTSKVDAKPKAKAIAKTKFTPKFRPNPKFTPNPNFKAKATDANRTKVRQITDSDEYGYALVLRNGVWIKEYYK